MAEQDVKIRLSVGGAAAVGSELAAVSGKLDALSGSVKTAAHYGAALAGTMAYLVPALGNTVRETIAAADAVTTLKNQLKLATGSAQAAGQAYEELFGIAQKSRVSFTELGGTFASISRAGSELGISQRRLLGVTEAIGNAMTIGGGSAQSMNAALVQLSQGLASGTLRGDELNSVMEQAPRLAQALAEGLGISRGELRKLGEAGEITAVKVIEALEKSAPKLATEVQGATVTVSQAFTVLQNETVKFAGDADKASGFTDTLTKALAGLSGGIATVGAAIRDNETAFSILFGTLASAAVAAGIYATGAAVVSLTGTLAGLATVVMAHPVLLAIGGIAAGVMALDQVAKAHAKTVRGMGEEVASLTQRINEAEKTLAGTKGGSALTAQMQARVDAMKKARAELQSQLAIVGAGNLDTTAEDARLARHTQTVKAAAQQEKALLEIRQKLSGVDKDYQKDLTTLHGLYEAGTVSLSEYQRLVGELAEKNYKAEKSAKDNAKAAREAAAEREKLAKAEQKHWDDLVKTINTNEAATARWLEQNDKTIDGLIAGNEALRLQNEAIGLTTEQTNALTLSRQDAAIALAELNLVEAQNIEGNEARVAQIEREIRLLKERRALTAAGQAATAAAEAQKTAKDAAEKTAKDAAAEWQKASDQIEQSLSDALMNGFTAGKGFAKSFTDSVKAMFNSMVLKPVISAIVSPVAGAAASALGFSGSANAATGGLGNLGNLAGIGGSLFGSTAAYAGAIGGGSVAAGSQAAMLAAQTGVFGAEGLAMTASAAGGMAGAMAPVLQGLMTAAPYLAAVAAVYMIAKSLDKSGTPHTGGGSQYSGAAGLQTTANSQFNGGFTGIGTSAGTIDFTTGVVKSVVGILDSTAVAFGKTAGYQAASSFADDSSKDGAWGSLVITKLGDKIVDWADSQSSKWAPKVFADGTAGNNEYLAAVSADVRSALDSIGLPAWAADMLNALGDAPGLDQLAATVQQINLTQTALAAMGRNLKGFADLSDAAVQALIAASGGIESLAANASAYYDAFYSDDEKKANTLRQVGQALQAVGLALPQTREEFRALVEQQQALGAAGAPAVAALLGVAGAFAGVVPAAEAAKDATTDLAAAEKALADERAGLMEQLWQATGQTAQIRARQMAALDASNRPIQQALYDIADAQTAFSELEKSVQKEKDRITKEYEGAKAALQEQATADLSYLKTAVDAQKEAIKAELDAKRQSYADQISAAQEARDAIAGIASALANAVKTVKIESEAYDRIRLNAARATISGAAASGNIKASGLEDALGVAGQDSKQFYATFEDYAFDQGKTAGEISALNDSAQSQLSEFDQTIAALKASDDLAKTLADAQMAALDAQYQLDLGTAQAQAALTAEGNAAQLAALDAQYQLDIAALDKTVADAQAQLDALLGINSSVLSVADALGGFTAAVTAAIASVANVAAAEAAVQASAQTATAIAAAMASSAAYVASAPPAGGSTETAHALGIMGFASGGVHRGGLRIVGENGPELEATGPSRIWTAPQIGAALGSNSSNAELIAEVRALRAELAAQNRAIAANTLETTKTLKRWNGDGMPEVRTV